jgi:glutamyl-tRNA reductase
MDQIGVVGLSYRHASTDDIAAFTLPKDEIAARLAALRDAIGTAELVYLATCNRVEVVFAAPEGEDARDLRAEVFLAITGRAPRPNEARSRLRAWTGEAAVEHLFLIACGLDSAQAGEREIVAQLRGAWDTAREAGVSGPMLDRVLGDALSLSGRLQRLAADSRPPSLADLAADRMLLHVAEKPSTVALVGVSPMTKRCGELLHDAGIAVLVVNRTADTGEEFARTIEATAVPLAEFRAQPRDVAGLIVATGGNEPVLDAEALRRLAKVATSPVLIIDFGLPPNIDPKAATDVGFARIGMNEMIQATQDRRVAQLLRLAPMRAAIDDRLAQLRSQLATRAIGKQLADLRNEFVRIAAAEADRALNEELQKLSVEQQEQVRRVAMTIAQRLAHLPLAGIRAAAAHASAETVDAFFREARLQRASRAAPAHTSGSTAAMQPAQPVPQPSVHIEKS